MVGKDHIINEIKRTTTANNGVPFGHRKFFAETGIREADWLRYWPRWSAAVREAGYAPNEKTIAYPADDLLEKLIGLMRELGRFPVTREINLKARNAPAFPGESVFRNRFGNRNSTIAAIVRYAGSRPGYEDVIRLCGSVSEAGHESTNARVSETDIGFVYLLKSGRYYKIGKSNAVSRRERELQIQLPEPANTVHVIRTDDPLGIEKYWHQRFGAKRKNGEWFDLNAADISAFRRRKFM